MYSVHVEATMHSIRASIILVETSACTAIARCCRTNEESAIRTCTYGAIASALGAAVTSSIAGQTIGSTVLALDDAIV